LKEDNIRLIFGLKVRHLRMDKNISLVDLSKETGISVSYLNEIEKGKKYPKGDKIIDLAKTLGVSYDWLVSLQLNQSLAPLNDLIKSDFFTGLPFEIFGIEPADLLDIISHTPSKMSAFVSTLIEISRNYAISVENFYFAVLRSYQEMHQNYFEDIENQAIKFCEENPNLQFPDVSYAAMKLFLEEKYHYEIEEKSFSPYPELKSLRSVLLPNKSNRLLINQELSEAQKMFTLGREIAYQYLKLKERPYTSSWIKIDTFDQLLNNFKASYFSGALLIPQKLLVADLQQFIQKTTWDESAFLELLQKYNVSPEMFVQRITNLMPRFFGLNQLFFLRFNHHKADNEFELDKELHLAGLYNPHGNMIRETYCRRWVSLNILKTMQQTENEQKPAGVICQIQRSQYFDSGNEFLCISLARSINPTPNTNTSVTIGFLMNNEFKKQVKFWQDPQIPLRKVGVTCERCSAKDCAERDAPATIYNHQVKTRKIQSSLEKLLANYK
jgi:transcriptional regulator with XRE-family HTH domain/predicted transcriptional regulator